MALTLFVCAGGRLNLPPPASLLLDRADGGNLVVLPPRDVWERGELTPDELTAFGFLVAAAGHAMLQSLPQLQGGCINYWEAGNWALNDDAEPRGRKTAREHRHMHLHLLGRSPAGKRWGESPKFPDYADRHTWAAGFARLTPAECIAIVRATIARLRSPYGVTLQVGWETCRRCGYPYASDGALLDKICSECEA